MVYARKHRTMFIRRVRAERTWIHFCVVYSAQFFPDSLSVILSINLVFRQRQYPSSSDFFQNTNKTTASVMHIIQCDLVGFGFGPAKRKSNIVWNICIFFSLLLQVWPLIESSANSVYATWTSCAAGYLVVFELPFNFIYSGHSA